jgi:hypothetical protein
MRMSMRKHSVVKLVPRICNRRLRFVMTYVLLDTSKFVPGICNRRLHSAMTYVLLDTSIESVCEFRVVALKYYVIFELSFEKRFMFNSLD